jgi:hypothetical protein
MQVEGEEEVVTNLLTNAPMVGHSDLQQKLIICPLDELISPRLLNSDTN